MEAKPVLEVGAENGDKAGRCQQVSTLKRRLETLTLKQSECVKYFADEAAWAITNHSLCNLWIERKEFQPGCYSGFSVFAKNTSVKNSSAKRDSRTITSHYFWSLPTAMMKLKNCPLNLVVA